MVDQTKWANGCAGFGGDAELDKADDEPSLGSLTSCGFYESQEHWAGGGTRDLERTGHATQSDECGPGFGNPDSGQYHTPEWRAHMKREFGEV